MTAAPRLTVGLPVYNGESFLAESIGALLGQSFENFELIISDNASTDGTEEICRHYERQDSRIRYFRQVRNIGLSPNHNFTLHQARGDLIKWASHDDLYARDLLKLCIEALDEYPEVVLAHSWTAMIDSTGNVIKADKYPLATASRHVPERFRSTLFASGGDDDGGVIRTVVLRRTAMKESYHHADRTIISELTLHGPFYQVPQWLYFRRDHPGRAERKHTSVRARCVNMDPRRADPVRNPVVRLYVEYVWAYIAAIRRAPLTSQERRECYQHLATWLVSRARPRRVRQAAEPRQDEALADISIDVLVPGWQRR